MNGGNDLIYETNIFPELMLDQNEAAFGSGTVQYIIVTAPHRVDAYRDPGSSLKDQGVCPDIEKEISSTGEKWVH